MSDLCTWAKSEKIAIQLLEKLFRNNAKHMFTQCDCNCDCEAF